MATPKKELVLEIKQEPSWQEDGFEATYKEDDDIRSPDSQATETNEMADLDNESATVEDMGEDWCEEETSNLCDPLAHMTPDVLHDSSDDAEGGSKRGSMTRGGTKRERDGKSIQRTHSSVAKPSRASPRVSKPIHPHHQGNGYEVLEVLSDTPHSPGKRNDTESPFTKKKKKYMRLVLSEKQENDLVQWLQSYPELFDKGTRKYKDIDYKNNLWEKKAAEFEVESGELLQVWYKSMRTRFGKLKKIKALKRRKIFTSRDKWILEKFAFIAPYISANPNRGAHLFLDPNQRKRQYIYDAPQTYPYASEEEANEDEMYNNLPTIPSSTTAPSTSAAVSTAASGNPSAAASATGQMQMPMDSFNPVPEATMANHLPHPGLQMAQSSGPTNQLLAGISAAIQAGQNDSMARGYGQFLATVAPSLHPSLTTQFYQESWALVMRYHIQSEQLKEMEQKGQPVPSTSMGQSAGNIPQQQMKL